MRKTPVSGFPRALLSLAVMRKRALESRLLSYIGRIGWWAILVTRASDLAAAHDPTLLSFSHARKRRALGSRL